MQRPQSQIQEHHMVSPLNIVQFLGQEAMKNGIPVPDTVLGIVKAELHRGLWIVRCPADHCSGAVGVTSVNPISMCPDCGAGWFRVEFPNNKAAIEEELLKRPTLNRRMVYTNWLPTGGRDKNGNPNGKPEPVASLRKQLRELREALANDPLGEQVVWPT